MLSSFIDHAISILSNLNFIPAFPLTNVEAFLFTAFYLPCTTLCLTALDEILQPDTSVSTHGFKPLNPVAVPKTQVLVKNLLDLQTAVSKQVPNKEAKNIGDMLFGAQTLMQEIMGKLF